MRKEYASDLSKSDYDFVCVVVRAITRGCNEGNKMTKNEAPIPWLEITLTIIFSVACAAIWFMHQL